MTFKSFIWPQKIKTESSDYNSNIEVVEYLGRRSIRVGGLTQSGSIVEDIYKNIFPVIFSISRNPKEAIKNILILGLGGGSFAKLVHKNLPEGKITGIEIDQKMITLARKYLKDYPKTMKVKCEDALKYVKSAKDSNKYDLIFTDMFTGDEYPQEISDKQFIQNLKKKLTPGGILIFNRLNWGKHKCENEKYIEMLRGFFSMVLIKKSLSNLLVFAY